MTTEEWRPIPGFPLYEVSNLGRVRSFKRRNVCLMKTTFDRKGYEKVCLFIDGRRIYRLVHQLVAMAFIGERPPDQQVRHLDGDSKNNIVENLCYGTVSENIRDQVRHGTHSMSRRSECAHGHAFDLINTRIGPDGSRQCRACGRMWQKKRRDAALSARKAA